MADEINLLRAKTGRSPLVATLVLQLRNITIVCFLAAVVVSLVIGGSFFYLRLKLSNLNDEKSRLFAVISADAKKEVTLRILKQELGKAGKIIAIQKPWSPILDLIYRVSSPPDLNTVSVNDKQEITLRMKTDSLDKTIEIVGRVISEIKDGHLKNPVLQNLDVNTDGTVTLSLSFISLL